MQTRLISVCACGKEGPPEEIGPHATKWGHQIKDIKREVIDTTPDYGTPPPQEKQLEYGGEFGCPHCYMIFESRHQMDSHIKRRHEKEDAIPRQVAALIAGPIRRTVTIQCPLGCGFVGGSDREIEDHALSSHLITRTQLSRLMDWGKRDLPHGMTELQDQINRKMALYMAQLAEEPKPRPTENYPELAKAMVREIRADAAEPFVVWFAKTLQNWKALLSTHVDDTYYEVTYNGDKKEAYIDVYVKSHNIVRKDR